jgi:hypothetical protein
MKTDGTAKTNFLVYALCAWVISVLIGCGAATAGSEDGLDQTVDENVAAGLFIGGSTLPVIAAADAEKGVTLASAMAWLSKNAVTDCRYTIVLSADEVCAHYVLSASFLNGATMVGIEIKSRKANTVLALEDTTGCFFQVTTGMTLTLSKNIILRGRTVSAEAAETDKTHLPVIVVGGTLVMKENALITSNGCTQNGFVSQDFPDMGITSYAAGGGVYVRPGGLVAMSQGSAITNCTAVFGGGIFVATGGTVTMTGEARIADNVARNQGGAVFLYGGHLKMSGSAVFSGNTACHGGGVHLDGRALFGSADSPISTMTMTDNASVENNRAFNTLPGIGAEGGGISTVWGTVALSGNARVRDNTAHADPGSGGWGAASYGGGICSYPQSYVPPGKVVITLTDNAAVIGNKATSTVASWGEGGGVYVSGVTFTMNGSATVSGNSAPIAGGVSVVNGSFAKTGGTTIYGDDAGTDLSNRATLENSASTSAIFATSNLFPGRMPPRRETTVGPNVDLFFSAADEATPEDHWDRPPHPSH